MDIPAHCDHRPTTGCERCLARGRKKHDGEAWVKGYIRENYKARSERARRKCSLDPTKVEEHQKEIFGDWNWEEEATRGHRSPPTPSVAPEETVNGLRLPKTSSPLQQLPPPEAGVVTETVDGWPVVRANANGSRKSSCDGQTSTTSESPVERVADGDMTKSSGLDMDKINNTLQRLRVITPFRGIDSPCQWPTDALQMSGGTISRKSSIAQSSNDSVAPKTMYDPTLAGPSERRRELNSYRYRIIGPHSVSGVPPFRKPEVESASEAHHEPQKDSADVVHLSIRKRTKEDAKTTFKVLHEAQMDSAIEMCADVSTKEDDDGKPRKDDYNTFHAD